MELLQPHRGERRSIVLDYCQSPSSYVHSGTLFIVVPGDVRKAPCACERTQVEQGRLASLEKGVSRVSSIIHFEKLISPVPFLVRFVNVSYMLIIYRLNSPIFCGGTSRQL